MSKLYIRVKKDGFIYEYNEIMAANPACEVITEEVLFPERFIPAHVEVLVEETVEPKVRTTRVKRKAALDLSTADIPEAPTYTPQELAEEASRGLP
jgi:hypothetical protein